MAELIISSFDCIDLEDLEITERDVRTGRYI